MGSFYSKQLGPTLAEKLQELTGKPHSEQLQLYEEIALARCAAAEALRTVAPVFEGNPNVTDSMRSLACGIVQEAMSNVAQLVETASRIEKNAEDKISVNVLNLFVVQITYAIYKILGRENLHLAKRIDAAIQETVRLPNTEKKVYDSSYILSRNAETAATEMDDATTPRSAAGAVVEQCEVQDCPSGSPQWENGISKTQTCPESDREEAVA